MQKWEYHVLFLADTNRNSVGEEFNELGKEGWELVSAVPVSWGAIEYVFKRPK